MPYVNIVTNQAVSKEQQGALIELVAPAVELIPGNVRTNLFIRIEADSALYFGSNPGAPCAMVSVELYGQSPHDGLSAYTQALCGALDTVLGVPREQVYISYAECRHWASAGNTKTAAE